MRSVENARTALDDGDHEKVRKKQKVSRRDSREQALAWPPHCCTFSSRPLSPRSWRALFSPGSFLSSFGESPRPWALQHRGYPTPTPRLFTWSHEPSPSPPPCVELCPILRAWSTKLIFLFSELHSHRPNHPPPPLFLSPFLRRVPTPPPKTTRRTLFILIFTVNRLLR